MMNMRMLSTIPKSVTGKKRRVEVDLRWMGGVAIICLKNSEWSEKERWAVEGQTELQNLS